MADGLRAAASGLRAQQALLDAVAADVANVSTPGYRAGRVAFRDLVDGAGAAAVEIGSSSRPGALVASDGPLALAIDGPGSFQVRGADGQVTLTRSGDFTVDANGQVVTRTGEQLVPPLKLPQGADPKDVVVAADGTVTVGTTTVGKIQLAGGAGSTLIQHQLEASGVDLAGAMTSLIEAQRAYALASRAVQMQDQLREIANGIRR